MTAIHYRNQFTKHKRLLWILAVCAAAIPFLSAQNTDFANLWRKAAGGDAKAQFELAQEYFNGVKVAKDPKLMLEWLRKSADQGYAGAEVALGVMYQNGGVKGIEKDPHEAAKWYRKAARQKNKNAQQDLSAMLAKGLITKQEADWRGAEPVELVKPVKEAKKTKPGPFSLSEVETGLTGGITPKRMSTLVGTYGVDFALSPTTKKRLTEEGADDNLLQLIASSKR